MRRAVLALVVVLLVLLCLLVWRLAVVAHGLDESIKSSSEDMKQVIATASRLSRKVDRMIDLLEQLESKAGEVVRIDEVKSVLDEVARLRTGAGEAGVTEDPEAQAEIRQLLGRIRRSGLKFECSGKTHSAARFYLHLYVKYEIYKKTLTSAEDFITKVATKTVAGNPYRVVEENGQKRELSGWLLEALRVSRARNPGRDRER